MKDGLYEGRTECYSVRTDWQSVLLPVRTDWQSVLRFLGVLLLVACPSVSAAAEVVRAELGKDTAWTGEAVPLIVTLYSPGPFSGTPAFDLPELPLTVFVKSGNPLVGTEQVDGESYFTQRHEFALYTQRVGEIVVPAFSVRFAGKKTFTSAPEPVEGLTAELRFRSRRPPGTDNLGVVVAAKDMEATQSWKPAFAGCRECRRRDRTHHLAPRHGHDRHDVPTRSGRRAGRSPRLSGKCDRSGPHRARRIEGRENRNDQVSIRAAGNVRVAGRVAGVVGPAGE